MEEVKVPFLKRSSATRGLRPNRRIESTGPSRANGRNDGVNTGAVGEPRVDHRRGLVDTPPDPGNDPLDDPHQMLVVGKADVGFFEQAGSLNIDVLSSVNEDIRDRRVVQERLERTEPEQLIEDFTNELLAFSHGERRLLALEHSAHDLTDSLPFDPFLETLHALQVDLFEQFCVDLASQLPVIG